MHKRHGLPPIRFYHFMFFVTIIISLLLCNVPAFALTGLDVMRMVQEQGRKYSTQNGEVELLIIDSENRKRKRFFKLVQRIEEDTTNRSIIRFFKPASVKGTAILSEKNDHTTKAKQWLFLPAFRTIRQLKGNNQDESFMGSDFSFSDIAGRTLEQDVHELVKEDEKYYYVNSDPKDKAEFYDKLEFIISKKFLLPLRVTFYNHDNEKIKTLSNKGVTEVKGMFIVQKALMENHITQGQSLMTRSNTNVKIQVHPNDVNIKALKK